MANGSYIGQVKIGENYYPVGSILYGVCDTAAATQDKTTILSNNYSNTDTGVLNDTSVFDDTNLTKGVTVHIKFIYSNTYDGDVYLKVANATKHKIVRYGTTNIGKTAATSWVAGSIVSFTYDGTNWIMNTGIDSNTTYSEISEVNINNTTGSTTGLITGRRFNAALTNRIDTSISSSSTDTQAASAKAVYTAIQESFAANDAMVFKDIIAGGSTGNYGNLTPKANIGDTYKVSTAGKINGIAVEIGDMLICTADNTEQATSSNYTTIANNWAIIQTNIDGAVTGPASATDGQVALFNGNTGKIIKNSSSNVGSETKPMYLSSGKITEGNTYAGGTAVTLNGTSKASSTAGFYAPTGAGTSGQVLVSAGSGAPGWKAAGISSGDSGDVTVVTARGTWSGGALPSITSNTNDTEIASVTSGTLTIKYFNAGTLPTLGDQSTTKIGVSLT